MIISIEEKIRENHWRKTFDLADSCKEMADQGMPYELISKAIKKPTSLVVSLVRMSKFFPEGERLLNVPIRVYLEAALYPDPVATVERAWKITFKQRTYAKNLKVGHGGLILWAMEILLVSAKLQTPAADPLRGSPGD